MKNILSLMSDGNPYLLHTPEDISGVIAERIRGLRLSRKWKQSTLAERAGVSVASLRRFERTGKGSIDLLLRLAFTLERLEDFLSLLVNTTPATLDELIELSQEKSVKRGSR